MRSIKHVVMLVKNLVSYDSRVLKESLALANHGYQVTIIGINTEDTDIKFPVEEKLSPNRTILRLKYKSQFVKTIHKMYLIISLMLFCIFTIMIIFQNTFSPILNTCLYFIPCIIFIYLMFLLHNNLLQHVNYTYTSYFKYVLVDAFLNYLIYKKIKALAPDIVHCHDYETLYVGYKYKKKTNCTLIYDSHEIYTEMFFTHNEKILKKIITWKEKFFCEIC